MSVVDTHELIEELVKAGAKKEVALVIAKATRQSNDHLVSKSDLKLSVAELRSEINGLRYEVKEDIAELRSEVKEDIAELRSEVKEDIAELKTNIKWISWVVIGVIIPMLVKLTFFPHLGLS